ncbi:MAG: concentrative nucleoside transporter, CNT family [Candidatus Magnetoglobus multicellularis str. Araruama]|uniref:Concentrative nucleoside transporter, CNT family n=1 Tax=Candidatus Magnetoglobus multicellularis str. Araruama TaxID=890399 RepID=A0A1V1P398_9BACT|nr:MAG: concentrative nucleoside transporter, CNT family [Candidatus Magnetoglobus multicellularis str. Araruama]
MSENRNNVSLTFVIKGVLIQLFIGVLLLKLPFFRDLFLYLNKLVVAIQESTTAGTSVVFGYLGGADLPFEEITPGSSFILAFQALPLLIVISALSALLFYWRILPVVVHFFSNILQKTMNIGGAEGVGLSANIFVGMVEAPVLIRPYLNKMTRSELFSLMTCGMATIAGTVMVLYASILSNIIPDAMGHILTASIISAPAAITIAKIMIPETDKITSDDIALSNEAESSMDAITNGTIQGVQLFINIIAMLISLVAIVHLINTFLCVFPDISGEPISLQRISGLIMSPLVWLMGIPWHEAPIAGALMGSKTILNEFIAYLDLSHLPEGSLQPKSLIIMTYALCGFANPGSLGIMIGGMGTMAGERRQEIVSLGFRSIVAGTLATCMTGAVVGIIL